MVHEQNNQASSPLEKCKRKKDKKKAKKLKKEYEKLKKLKHKKKLEHISKKLKKYKERRKKYKEEKKIKEVLLNSPEHKEKHEEDSFAGPSYDVIANSKTKAPMTKEEWEKQQSIIRRVYDPETGRHRLVKGSGEILEECVSRERHKAINKAATMGDGAHFQAVLQKKVKKLS